MYQTVFQVPIQFEIGEDVSDKFQSKPYTIEKELSTTTFKFYYSKTKIVFFFFLAKPELIESI